MRDSKKPLLVMISKIMTPYLRHQQVRIAREIPETRLASLYLQRSGMQSWHLDVPPEIGAVWMEGDEDRPRLTPVVWRFTAMWSRASQVIEWLEKNHPAVVVVPGYYDIGRLRIIRWCLKHNVPVYLFTDTTAAAHNDRGVWRILTSIYLRWIVRNVSGLLVCGRGGVDFFRPYGGDGKPTFYVPHETDYAAIEALTDEEIRETKRRFGIRDDRRYLVYCGRMAGAKRVDLLIDAFVRIADERPDWDLLLIGDGRLRESLQQRVPESLNSRVIWTGFINEPETIRCLYRAGDAFVLPSEREPWGAVIPEACGAGLAIVSSDVVGSALELVRDGENGRLFRSGDCGSLAQTLRDVTDADRIDSMRLATRDVLADWRRRGDPVMGIRKMLVHAGAIPATSVKSSVMVET